MPILVHYLMFLRFAYFNVANKTSLLCTIYYNNKVFYIFTMAEKRRFTTQMIARNMLKNFFVSSFWSVILIITVTIR